MSIGVVFQRADGSIEIANRAAEQILGLTLDQMLGRTSADPRWKAIWPDGSPAPGEEHPAMVALREGRRVGPVVFGVFHPGAGEYRWINVNAVPELHPAEQRPFRVFTTFEDVTDRHRLQEHTTFIVALSRELSFLSDPVEITRHAERLIGAHVQAEHCEFIPWDASSNEPLPLNQPCMIPVMRGDTVIAHLCVKLPDPLQLRDDERQMLLDVGERVFTSIERAKVQRELERSNRRFVLAEEAAPGFVYELENPNADVYRSQGLDRVLGYAREEFGKNRLAWTDLIHPDDADLATASWDSTVDAGPYQYDLEYRVRHKDGRYSHVWDRGVVDRKPDGSLISIVGNVVDITDRKERELLARRQASLIDLSYDAIVILDWDGKILFWSKGAERLYGYSAEIAVGQVIQDFLVTEFPVPRDELMATLITDGSLEAELVHTTADGRQLWIDSRHQLIEQDGERFVLETNRDATGRKRLESVRQTFLAGVAHDVRSPLTVAVAQTQLAQLRLTKGKLSPEQFADSLATIQLSHARLQRRIAELIDSLRWLTAADIAFNPGPTNLSRIVDRLVAEYRRTTTSHDLLIDGPAEPLLMTGDSERLERVLDNLLSNAIKYSPHGGTITVTQRRDGDWVHLAVADQGIGIPKADLPTLLEPYRRATNVLDSIGGSGLGLANVAQIVRAHGGTVVIDSEIGAGTTVTVKIPHSQHATTGA